MIGRVVTFLDDRIVRDTLSVFEDYIIHKSRNDPKERRSQLILKVFKFWLDMNLPLSRMEEFCVNNMHKIGDCLSHIVMHSTQPKPLYLSFSHKFYLKIIHAFVKSQKTFQHGKYQ